MDFSCWEWCQNKDVNWSKSVDYTFQCLSICLCLLAFLSICNLCFSCICQLVLSWYVHAAPPWGTKMKLVKEQTSFKDERKSWYSLFSLHTFYSICLITGCLTRWEKKVHMTWQQRIIIWSSAAQQYWLSYLEVSSSARWATSIILYLITYWQQRRRSLLRKDMQLIRNQHQK